MVARPRGEEAEGKTSTRGTRSAYEASPWWARSRWYPKPNDIQTRRRRCNGHEATVTRLTLGDLPFCSRKGDEYCGQGRTAQQRPGPLRAHTSERERTSCATSPNESYDGCKAFGRRGRSQQRPSESRAGDKGPNMMSIVARSIRRTRRGSPRVAEPERIREASGGTTRGSITRIKCARHATRTPGTKR